MRDQVFTALPEHLDDLFSKLLAANVVIKNGPKSSLLKFYNHKVLLEYH